MRYEGKKEVIQDIEKIVRGKALCFEYKPKTRDNLFGIPPSVQTVILDVVHFNFTFTIRLFYDNRANSPSNIDVLDVDVWRLCKISPEIIKLLAQLEESVNEKQELLHNRVIIKKEATT